MADETKCSYCRQAQATILVPMGESLTVVPLCGKPCAERLLKLIGGKRKGGGDEADDVNSSSSSKDPEELLEASDSDGEEAGRRKAARSAAENLLGRWATLPTDLRLVFLGFLTLQDLLRSKVVSKMWMADANQRAIWQDLARRISAFLGFDSKIVMTTDPRRQVLFLLQIFNLTVLADDLTIDGTIPFCNALYGAPDVVTVIQLNDTRDPPPAPGTLYSLIVRRWQAIHKAVIASPKFEKKNVPLTPDVFIKQCAVFMRDRWWVTQVVTTSSAIFRTPAEVQERAPDRRFVLQFDNDYAVNIRDTINGISHAPSNINVLYSGEGETNFFEPSEVDEAREEFNLSLHQIPRLSEGAAHDSTVIKKLVINLYPSTEPLVFSHIAGIGYFDNIQKTADLSKPPGFFELVYEESNPERPDPPIKLVLTLHLAVQRVTLKRGSDAVLEVSTEAAKPAELSPFYPPSGVRIYSPNEPWPAEGAASGVYVPHSTASHQTINIRHVLPPRIGEIPDRAALDAMLRALNVDKEWTISKEAQDPEWRDNPEVWPRILMLNTATFYGYKELVGEMLQDVPNRTITWFPRMSYRDSSENMRHRTIVRGQNPIARQIK